MALLSNNEFLASLGSLLTAKKVHGSVFLTQKRYSYDPSAEEDSLDDLSTDKNFPILIRATDGKSSKEDTKVKFSTLVNLTDLDSFFTRYGDICRAGMTTLKKRDRKKTKTKAKKKPTKAAA
ncbi:signal recognition particle, SRP9/SRP14 subunit [Saitoella complicata NRRL Y-17804]|nr:signal recognition particle, SRP9/SRP14 subunit [Saitoella complicata NRRL Y-17804]ODQ56385.1 signal recognition particle, SRP9/SRP14 subunit [Saitoella complicata NRRL Y-17804]